MANDALIDVSASGDTPLVAAPGVGRFIRVLSYHVTAVAAVTTKFKSGSSVKDIVYSTTVAGGGLSVPTGQDGVFDCAVNEALNINLSAAVAVGGTLKYMIYGCPPGNF